jgi:hypothetical protein
MKKVLFLLVFTLFYCGCCSDSSPQQFKQVMDSFIGESIDRVILTFGSNYNISYIDPNEGNAYYKYIDFDIYMFGLEKDLKCYTLDVDKEFCFNSYKYKHIVFQINKSNIVTAWSTRR